MVYFPVPESQSEPLLIAFHCDFVPLNVMLVSPEHPANAKLPMLVTLLEIVTLVSPEHP